MPTNEGNGDSTMTGESFPQEDTRTSTEVAIEKRYWSMLDTGYAASVGCSGNNRHLACPVMPLTDAIDVFGFFDEGRGTVVFFDESIPIPRALAHIDEAGRMDQRMRSSGQCLAAGCVHWTGGSCRLGSAVSCVGRELEANRPSCAIRNECRWFAENGGSACHACVYIHRIPFAERGRLAASAGPGDATLGG